MTPLPMPIFLERGERTGGWNGQPFLRKSREMAGQSFDGHGSCLIDGAPRGNAFRDIREFDAVVAVEVFADVGWE